MSEKDPRAEKRKDINDKSRMDDEMINDAVASKNSGDLEKKKRGGGDS
jgi:hypothetical protein